MARRPARDSSVDAAEIDRFDRIGEDWWNPTGSMRALHRMNPVRVTYLRELLCRRLPREGDIRRNPQAEQPLTGLKILDIGCGGGLLAEALAACGAAMTAIDPAPQNIEIARRHAETSGLAIDYRCATADALVAEEPAFDAVLAMEVVEHVRDVQGFLRDAAALVRPGGILAVATLNRTAKSYALAIVGAEYVLRWVERGTHDWQHFVRPDELARALRAAGLDILETKGVGYNPLTRRWRLETALDVNYMMAAQRP